MSGAVILFRALPAMILCATPIYAAANGPSAYVAGVLVAGVLAILAK